jgi:hypothetical protein
MGKSPFIYFKSPIKPGVSIVDRAATRMTMIYNLALIDATEPKLSKRALTAGVEIAIEFYMLTLKRERRRHDKS